MPVVKGISRRVVVVESPDPELFEQAIFIVRSDALSKEGVTEQKLLGEACRIARGYGMGSERTPLWKRIPLWGYSVLAALAAAALWLCLWFGGIL